MKYLSTLIFLILCFQVQADDIDGWSAPTTVSTLGIDASSPTVGIDTNGNAIAAWVEGGVIRSSNQLFGANWDTATSVSGTGSSSPRIAVDQNGNATLVWISNGAIQTASKPFGGTWSAAHVLASSGLTPQIGIDLSGNVVAVWVSSGVVMSATKLFGGNWPTTADTISASGADTPRVSIGSSGQVFAIWHAISGVASVDTIYVANKTLSGGTWSTPQTISSPTQNSIYPQIAVDSSGNAIAVWFTHQNMIQSFVAQPVPVFTNVAVQASMFNSTSTIWSIPVNISASGIRDPKGNSLKIGFTSGGDAVALWTNSYDGRTFNVEENVYNNGTGWLNPTQILNDIYAYTADLAVLPVGDAFLAYMTSEGTNSTITIQVSETNAGGPFEEEFGPHDISTGTFNAYPRIAASQSSDSLYAIVVWQNRDGANTVIQSSVTSGLLIAPPTNLTITPFTNNFGVFTENAVTIAWTASTDPRTDSYIIYRNDILLTVVDSSTTSYVDNNVPSGVEVNYSVAALYTDSQSTTISLNFP